MLMDKHFITGWTEEILDEAHHLTVTHAMYSSL